MTVWDWLSSPTGIELEHAVILLITAIAAYLTYVTNRKADDTKKLLNSHLEQHVKDAVEDSNGDS